MEALNIDDSRPELKGFRDHYAEIIEPFMAAQEEKQKAAWMWAVSAALIGLAITGFLLWWLYPAYLEIEHWSAVVILFSAILTGVVSCWKLMNLQKSVKEHLISKVCEFFNFGYKSKASGLRFSDYKDSGLLPKNYDSSDTEDLFYGTQNEVDFEFFECTLDKTKGDEGSKKVYHGVLFRFSFPKSFKGRTIVLKEKGSVGRFFQGATTTGERVILEDPRFEKIFDVWGTDPIEARYILTPTFMERVVELANAIDSKRIELSLRNNELMISVHVKKDQFEGGGIFTRVRCKKRVEKLVNEICRVFDIVDTLQLALKTRV